MTTKNHNARCDTYEHIKLVNSNLINFAMMLLHRATAHDQSKLEEPEASIFEEVTSKLQGMTYGTAAYMESLKDLGPALEHHYKNNPHHPEFWPEGIRGMELVDLVEMFCDWAAATMRHADGCLIKSINKNQERFKYSDDLKEIFLNSTASVVCKISPEYIKPFDQSENDE